MRNKNEKGFTLIELLVVIAIIGLLASVVLLALNSARAKSRDAKRLADIRQIASGLELYYNDCGGYPISSAGTGTRGIVLGSTLKLQTGTSMPTNGTCTAADSGINATAAGTAYMGSLPSAPNPADTGCTTALTDGAAVPAAFAVTKPAAVLAPASTYNDYVWYPNVLTNSATDYNVTFCLGAATGGTASGPHVLTASGIK